LGTTSVVAAILSIGILIILHEAGHYFAARWSGMRVRRFAIGFGPALAKIVRRGTEFRIGTVPLGGYVQIDGLSPQDGTDPAAGDNYMSKPAHLRFATLFAGPAANYVFGFVLLVLFYAFFFVVELPPLRVVEVVDGSPASKAGLVEGDIITGTSSAAFEAPDDFLAAIKASGGKLALRVERSGEAKTIVIEPEPVDGGFRIGVGYEATKHDARPLGLGDGIAAAWSHIGRSTVHQLKAFGALFRGGARLSGPIGMVQGLARQAEASWSAALGTIADLSIAVGLFNLFPVPALDGSRLMFLIIGLIRRKPIERRFEAIVHFVGFVLLILLFVAVSIGDLLR
jgi:regulator of sigma E protease